MLSLQKFSSKPLPLEVVERKGLGHPDTIADGIAEFVSRRLSTYYLDRWQYYSIFDY